MTIVTYDQYLNDLTAEWGNSEPLKEFMWNVFLSTVGADEQKQELKVREFIRWKADNEFELADELTLEDYPEEELQPYDYMLHLSYWDLHKYIMNAFGLVDGGDLAELVDGYIMEQIEECFHGEENDLLGRDIEEETP